MEGLDKSICGLASPRRVRRVSGLDFAKSIACAIVSRAGRPWPAEPPNKSEVPYRERFGALPPHQPAGGVVDTGHDFAALDLLMPHPVYA
jgi:hypothetical protein